MKAIISHDIDHLTVWEHTHDLILPKFIIRAHIELVLGKISLLEYSYRVKDFFKNKWQQIDELIGYNISMGVPSFFFIGVNNGVGLSYPLEKASYWIHKLTEQNIELGVHGIAYDSFEKVNEEFELFKNISSLSSFGIRMHYVRNDGNTLNYIEKSGYCFDSTEHAFKNPYKIGNLWEFPFQIMDGWILNNNKPWQSQNLEQAKYNTLLLIDKAQKENIEYLGIIFHDRYFSNSFKTWKNWYIWLIDYLKSNKIEFVNFKQAIQKLESINNEPAHTHSIFPS
ncbi:MAG: hypothetical protein ABI315_14850 [Bacteroidia bacterium]